jgi:CO/xanthine dehydrogenase FAD-binding subunit
MAISIVSLAWRWVREPDGTLSGVRLALGAVAPVVARAVEAEASLEGRRPDAHLIEQACRAIRESVSPIDDVRASAWYRREVAGNLLMEALSA